MICFYVVILYHVNNTPFCHIHLSKEYGVKIKQSTIQAAGRGLFATKDFNRNEIICPIWGVEKTVPQVQHDYGINNTPPYTIELTRTKRIDGACHRYIGQQANTQLRMDGQSSLRKSNAIIHVNHQSHPYKLFIKANKPMNYEYKRVKR